MTLPEKCLVLGIGNLLFGDEGIGVHVVRDLQQPEQLPQSNRSLKLCSPSCATWNYWAGNRPRNGL